MKKAYKVLLIVAVSLIVSGFLISLVATFAMRFDLTKLSTSSAVNKVYDITENFEDIDIDAAECDVTVKLSDTNKCQVVVSETENIKHVVTVEDRELKIWRNDMRKWYDFIGININKMHITLSLTQQSLDELNIKTASGNVTVDSALEFEEAEIKSASGDISFLAKARDELTIATASGDIDVKNSDLKEIELTSASGSISVSNVKCNNFTASTASGKIMLNSLISSDQINAKTASGKIELKDCDAGELILKSVSGKVEGILLSDKTFIAKSTSGNIAVPNTVGGVCRITTTSGNIHFEIK